MGPEIRIFMLKKERNSLAQMNDGLINSFHIATKNIIWGKDIRIISTLEMYCQQNSRRLFYIITLTDYDNYTFQIIFILRDQICYYVGMNRLFYSYYAIVPNNTNLRSRHIPHSNHLHVNIK